MLTPEPQPAKGILALLRITNRQVADHLNVSPEWVGRVLNGYVKPPKRFKAAVADLTDTPEADLFRSDR